MHCGSGSHREIKRQESFILKEICGCDKVISFGDAINDIPMFEISDECYAVENAVEELKAAADGVIQSNENDGVATWLEQHVRLNAETQ